MAVNAKLIRERLAKMKNKNAGNTTYEKTDYSKIFFKPTLGKQTVRIVPSKFNKDVPYTEVEMHNYNAFKKSIYSLSNWGEKDPILQMRKQLFNDDTQESKDIAFKIKPRTRSFVNVIVRGQEHLGVRLWEFGPQTLEKLLEIIGNDDEYGDITDLVEGTDLTIEGYEAVMEGTKKKYIDVSITPKRKTSPLSEDPKEIELWLESQKNPLEIYKKYSFEEISDLLKAYLFPEENSTDTKETRDIVKGASVAKTTASKFVEEKDKNEEKEVVKVQKETVKKTTAKSKKPTVAEMLEDDDLVDDLPFTDEENDSNEEEIYKGNTKTAKATTKPQQKVTTASSAKSKWSAFDDDED